MQVHPSIKKIQDFLNYNFDIMIEKFDFIDHSKKFKEINKLVKEFNAEKSDSDKIIIAEKVKIQSKLAKISLEDCIEQIDVQVKGLKKNIDDVKNATEELKASYDEMNDFDKETSDYILLHVDLYLGNDILLLNDLLNEENILKRMIKIIEVQKSNMDMIEERAEEK